MQVISKIVWPVSSKESLNDDVETVQMKNDVSHESLSSFVGNLHVSCLTEALTVFQFYWVAVWSNLILHHGVSSGTSVLIFSSCQLFLCPQTCDPGKVFICLMTSVFCLVVLSRRFHKPTPVNGGCRFVSWLTRPE